jgi:hypothetical protein
VGNINNINKLNKEIIMAAGQAILAAIGLAQQHYKGKQDKAMAQKESQIQQQRQAQEKVGALKAGAEQAKQAQIGEISAKKASAASTEKIAERKKRRGKRSLLTGSEAGLNQDIQTIV